MIAKYAGEELRGLPLRGPAVRLRYVRAGVYRRLQYVGHVQLGETLNALAEHLPFWWPCACVHTGKQALTREYGIRVGWKPMLWFVKKTRDDTSAIVHDVVSGGAEKDHHDWQQAQAEAEYWIEKLCPQDGIVCDPFLGGGTTAAAAERLGRPWIGMEIDAEQAAVASARIKNGNKAV
jgi:hypothetical protein